MASHALSDQISDRLWRARKRTRRAMHHGRTAVADALDSAAMNFSAGAEHMADAARATSDRMEASARWVRTTSGREVWRSIKAVIKAHPTRTAVGAVVVGMVVARAFRHR